MSSRKYVQPVRNFKKGPEAVIQADIIDMLRLRSWRVKETHGNMYSSGWPDLYAFKRGYGSRWIEVKNPENYVFQPSQIEDFHAFTAEGIGVWILVAATEAEYAKLFEKPNWYQYLDILK